MNLKFINLTERNHSENVIYYINSRIWHYGKDKIRATVKILGFAKGFGKGRGFNRLSIRNFLR